MKKPSLAVAWLLMTQTIALATEPVMHTHTVKSGETLSGVLYDMGVRRRHGLYGEDGWVNRNMKLNSHVSNWNELQPGSELKLELPGAPLQKPIVDSVEKPAKKAKAPEPEKPSVPEVPTVAKWDIRAALGITRSRYSETTNNDTTVTEGLWGVPRVSLWVSHWRELAANQKENSDPREFSREKSWQYGVGGSASNLLDLNGVGFPLAFTAQASVARRNMVVWEDTSPKTLSPLLAFEFERNHQGAPDRRSTTLPIPYVLRSTNMMKIKGGAVFRIVWADQWLDLTGDLFYAPYGQSTVEFQPTTASARGFGGDLRVDLGFGRHFFTGLNLSAYRLSGDVTLFGNVVGLDAGWKF